MSKTQQMITAYFFLYLLNDCGIHAERLMNNFKGQVVEACKKTILYTPHAINQMAWPDRMITKEEVRETILQGEIIEDYPEDTRGHSCLLMAFVATKRIIHVVCSPKQEYLTIISAYLPNADQWASDFKTRKSKNRSN